MIIINGDRCSGRSTAAINYVENHPGVILVVPTRDRSNQVRREYKHIDVISSETFNEYHYRRANQGQQYFIDDFDQCFDNQVIGIVTTGKVETLKAEFKTPEQLRVMINSLGVEKFNKFYPSWKIKDEV